MEIFNYTPKYDGNQNGVNMFDPAGDKNNSRSANKRLNLFSKGDLMA